MMRWTVALEGGPQRVNHAACNVREKIYSFGGYCTGEDYHYRRPIDVHLLNGVSLRWTLVRTRDATGTGENVPFQRYGHTVVPYGETIFLWGGRNDEGACNVVYAFDASSHKWTRPKTTGVTPECRDGHSACVVGNCMYVFGGYEEDSDRFSQDVHCLNLDTMQWTFRITFGEAPQWRDFHSASALGNRMYIFGGRSDKEGPFHSQNEVYNNDITFLDLKNFTWNQPVTCGSIPEGRRSHSAFVFKDKLYIFGGYNGVTDKHFNCLYCFDPENNVWTQVEAKGKRTPCPRRRQCCCLVNDKLYLFGGTSPITDKEVAQDFNYFHYIDSRLMDHSDLYILDFAPSLKTLSILAVTEASLDISVLPKDIRMEIEMMTTNNVISRLSPSSG